MNIKYILLFSIILLTPFLSSGKDNNGFETDSVHIIVNKIIIAGNKKTKKKIILRELLFKEGDTLGLNQLDYYILKSKENLNNTFLFNYITINTSKESEGWYNIYIILEERWYLWPYIIFEQADRNLSAFIHNKDWSRVNYGIMMVKNNFRGLGETVKLKVRLGYKEQFEVAYKIPYLGNSHQHGLSMKFNWFRQHEIPYITQDDKLVFYRDKITYVAKEHNSEISYHYRNKHYLRHTFSAKYSFAQVEDTIIQLNGNYFNNSSNQTQYITLQYYFNLDKRDYKLYPLKGYNIDFSVTQKGLNILPNEIQGVWAFESSAYLYSNFNGRWYSGIGGKAKMSSNYKQPYFIEEALGYETFLRSFEYNVIDGQNYATGRTFIKYAIIPEKIIYLESLNLPKFNKIHYSLYINTFFDAGYVTDINPYATNTLPNTFLASAGIGIDIVAYYDMVLRLEYSINRFVGHGFYIHMGKAF